MEQLPGFVLADLYGKSLVVLDDETKQSSPQKSTQKNIETKQEKKFLGNYEKPVVVLVSDAENIFMDDENLQFLSGILNACKLNLAQIALINFHNYEAKFTDLKKEMKPKFLILFGVTALQIEMPFTLPDYQVQSYDNSKIMVAPNLKLMNNNSAEAKAEKTKLWKSLKNMFGL